VEVAERLTAQPRPEPEPRDEPARTAPVGTVLDPPARRRRAQVARSDPCVEQHAPRATEAFARLEHGVLHVARLGLGTELDDDDVGAHLDRAVARRRDPLAAGHVAHPSNSEVTEPSSKTSRIARAMSGAIDSTVSFSKRWSSGMGSVSVTTTSRAPHSCKRRAAGSERTPCVAATMTSFAPSLSSTR